MRKRNIEIKIRLSPEEFALLQRNLAEAGMNRNTYLVHLITGATIYPKDQLIRLNLEYTITNRLLRGIATNINQIARKTNASGHATSKTLLLDMSQDIRVLKNNLVPLWEETRQRLWQS